LEIQSQTYAAQCPVQSVSVFTGAANFDVHKQAAFCRIRVRLVKYLSSVQLEPFCVNLAK
jgi:hypothetical protein